MKNGLVILLALLSSIEMVQMTNHEFHWLKQGCYLGRMSHLLPISIALNSTFLTKTRKKSVICTNKKWAQTFLKVVSVPYQDCSRTDFYD